MKNYYLALMVSALLTLNVYAEDVEEVIVTASLTNQTVSDLKDPLHVVDGEDVTAGGVQSLGVSAPTLTIGNVERSVCAMLLSTILITPPAPPLA